MNKWMDYTIASSGFNFIMLYSYLFFSWGRYPNRPGYVWFIVLLVYLGFLLVQSIKDRKSTESLDKIHLKLAIFCAFPVIFNLLLVLTLGLPDQHFKAIPYIIIGLLSINVMIHLLLFNTSKHQN